VRILDAREIRTALLGSADGDDDGCSPCSRCGERRERRIQLVAQRSDRRLREIDAGDGTESHFKRTRLSVEEPVGRVKRRFAVATGCSAR